LFSSKRWRIIARIRLCHQRLAAFSLLQAYHECFGVL
jgi:hypothetical protein